MTVRTRGFRGPGRLTGIIFLVIAAGLAAQPPGTGSGTDGGLRGRVLEANEAGVRAYEAGRFGEAVARFEEARALDSSDAAVGKNLARALHARTAELVKAGRVPDAVRDLERAIGLDPDEVRFPVRLAQVHKDDGDLEAARRVLGRALEAKPGAAALHEALGRLEYDDERLDKAVDLIETACRLDPELAKSLNGFLDKVRREAEVEKGLFRDQSANLVVKYDDQAFRAVGQSVLRLLEALQARLTSDFDHRPTRRLSVVLYTRGDFDAVTGAKEWAGGLYDGKIRLPVRNFDRARSAIEATLAHELTHFYVRSLAPSCPLWLNEGLAQYQEGRRAAQLPKDQLRRARDEERLPSVASLPDSWASITDREKVALYYAIALSFTEHLIARYGFPAVRDYLVSLDAPRVFGKPLSDLESAWRLAF